MGEEIRLTAFEWLRKQIAFRGDVLPRELLVNGFVYEGHRVTLMGPSGIWKPKVFRSIPISITTVADGPYNDKTLETNFSYSYRGGIQDIYHRDNVGLREAMRTQTPLIYFLGLAKSRYLVIYPVFITGDDIQSRSFIVEADHWDAIKERLLSNQILKVSDTVEDVRRSYITIEAKLRLHQRIFREQVLSAYNIQCTFCRIRHEQLLDAAHIIADSEDKGDPVVQNGLSLCKIHHAAFDSNIIGVTPDFRINVREDILSETDGPMLRYGIQDLQNQKILLPSHKNDWPDKERLDVRYTQFREFGLRAI